MKRVRFAPSPTGTLHIGNALSAVANRSFGDWMLLRIDDTDPARNVPGGEEADPRGPRVARARLGRRARPAERARRSDTARPPPSSAPTASKARRSSARTAPPPTSSRPSSTTSTSGSRTSSAGTTTGRTRRSTAGCTRRSARQPPEYVHHGLILGADGKKLSKRAEGATVASLRDAGIPAEAVRAYLEELGLPKHDVHLDLARIRRLAIEAIEAMTRRRARRVGPSVDKQYVPVMRGARDLVEAQEFARQVERAADASTTSDTETLTRFKELVDLPPKDLVRELKAAGGDLKALRLALTGRDKGPELSAILAALPKEEALRRVDQALQHAQP